MELLDTGYYSVRTIEEFQDLTNLMKQTLPKEKLPQEIHILIEATKETYRWNYITRTFDLLKNYAYSTPTDPGFPCNV